jgi:predicted TIM-barrel fold metal-dependent hydrolase
MTQRLERRLAVLLPNRLELIGLRSCHNSCLWIGTSVPLTYGHEATYSYFMTAPLRVDTHAHVFLRSMPLAAARRYAPDFDATSNEYLGLLDAHGCTHGVLVQPSFLGFDNSYLLNVLRRHPQRLRGVVMLEPTTPEQELAALAAAGVVGVRLNLVGQPLPDLRLPVWQAFLQRIRALDWHLELHRRAADLSPLIKAAALTGCRIVVDHFGRPDPEQASADPGFAALLRHADSGQLWVKLSAAYRNAHDQPESDAGAARECARQLLAAFGPQRLVWGSDWPHTQHQHLATYGASLAALTDWVPDATQRRQILGATAAELFHIFH